MPCDPFLGAKCWSNGLLGHQKNINTSLFMYFKNILKKIKFLFYFFFASIYFFVFSNRFDVLISKIIFKK
jgi:hypothetical protein